MKLSTGMQYFSIAVILIISIQALGCIGSMTPTATPSGPTAIPSRAGTPVPSALNISGKAPQAVSAMEGYKIAKETALGWNKDAVLSGAVGYTYDYSSIGLNTTVDGKSMMWQYLFKSASAIKKYGVSVSDGSVAMAIEIPANKTAGPSDLDCSGLHAIDDWKADSTQVTQAAVGVFLEKYGVKPATARYELVNSRNSTSGKVDFYWSIEMNSPVTFVNGTSDISYDSLTVYADPGSGKIIADPFNGGP